jgi:hypothetical protein
MNKTAVGFILVLKAVNACRWKGACDKRSLATTTVT